MFLLDYIKNQPGKISVWICKTIYREQNLKKKPTNNSTVYINWKKILE